MTLLRLTVDSYPRKTKMILFAIVLQHTGFHFLWFRFSFTAHIKKPPGKNFRRILFVHISYMTCL